MYEIFQKLLDKRGLKAFDVSKATGISSSTLTDWKKGRSVPKQDKMQKIAEFFGVSLEYLMTGSEKESTASYYLNDETKKIAQEMFEKDRVLFEVYRSSDKDRLIAYAKKLKSLRDMEEGDVWLYYNVKGNDINVILLDDALGVPGSIWHNADGSYSIFIDARLSLEKQKEVFKHELNHILKDDFSKENADLIEFDAHSAWIIDKALSKP